MTLRVKMLTLGMISTNCFVVGDDESQAAVVIENSRLYRSMEERAEMDSIS